jgi:methionine-rich copper-binding protein CopC
VRTARTVVLPAIAALMLAASPGLATAHAELVSSQPPAGAILETAPAEIALTFSAELDAAASGFVVTDPDGTEVGEGTVDLDVAERNILRGAVVIAGDGLFEVRWTAVAVDGHVEHGSFTFNVGDGGAPDTALPGRSPTWPLGAILVALSLVTAARRLRRTIAR